MLLQNTALRELWQLIPSCHSKLKHDLSELAGQFMDGLGCDFLWNYPIIGFSDATCDAGLRVAVAAKRIVLS